MTARVVIEKGSWRAQIAPDIGGAILGLTLYRVPIMRTTPEEAVVAGEVRGTAGFPRRAGFSRGLSQLVGS